MNRLQTNGHAVVLASGSPRRRELLSTICDKFTVVVSGLDETMPADCDPRDLAVTLAESKALEVAKCLSPAQLQDQSAIVIGADTVVSLGAKRLEKPGDEEEAIDMLMELSGMNHTVFTGVCAVLRSFNKTGPSEHQELKFRADAARTQVTFRAFSRDEAQRYVRSEKPLDKAGAYGIQDPHFDFAVRVEGPIDNVIGFPLELVQGLVQDLLNREVC